MKISDHTRRAFLKQSAAIAAAAAFARSPLAAQVAVARPQDNHGPEPARLISLPDAWPPSARRLAMDPLRPQFHLLPRYGWMNDPNAPAFWRGKYHIFFQYNPGAATWGDMHWAHAISSDMVHWQHLPVALAPTPASADSDGCFTGSFVDDSGTAAIVYTGVESVSDPKHATLRDGTHNFRETQLLATTADPLLRSWQKLPVPVIAAPPQGMQVTGFRDPSVWRQGDFFYMTVGSGTSQGGMVLLYRSPANGADALREWEYLHPLFEGHGNGGSAKDPVDSGTMWECPELFPLGDRHVLIYSTERKVYWVVGQLDPATMKFAAQKSGLLDGGNYYAPKTQLDAAGNRILWGWVSEARPDDELKAAGWAGCISLPRVLGIDSAGTLTMEPAQQVRSLRGQHVAATIGRNPAASPSVVLPTGACAEVHAVFQGQDAVLRLTDDSGAQPWLEISATVVGDTRLLRIGERSVPMPATDEVDLRVFVDGSVVEIFANRTACLTQRVYRKVEGSLRASALGVAAVETLEAWAMRPISSDRLTI